MMSTLSTTSLSDMTPQGGEESQGEDDHLRPSPLSADGVTAADDAGSKYIVAKLKELYRCHVVDAERRYNLHFNFALPTDGEIKDSEFDANPLVLLIGQYSTGKTTFLNHLLQQDFPGMHIGPEPTTDKFTALFHNGQSGGGDSNDRKLSNSGFQKKKANDDAVSVVTDDIRASGRLLKGNTLTVTPNLPFSSLSQFGSAFLNHFVGSSASSPLLERLTFIDTPGVLSGEKQRINRTYDFGNVAKWFADRSDLILLLFDAHKLDISDEFKSVIDTIRQHNDDKIRCVLNKADSVTREQLVRVYGSLMWSMGKIFDSPEVVRVYTGSFWNGALINSDFAKMFDKDEKLLVRELMDLPRCASERKVNQMVNRIRLVKVHVCILGTIRRLTPRFFGKKSSREEILNDIETIMDDVRIQYDLSQGDMPNPNEFRECLEKFSDFSVFPKTDLALVKKLDFLLDTAIPDIVNNAEIVVSDVRLGRPVQFVHESADNASLESKGTVSATSATGAAEDKVKSDCKGSSSSNLAGKVVTILVLLTVLVQGAFYMTFSRPVSFSDLDVGYRKLAELTTTGHSPGSRTRDPIRPTRKSSTPLSNLPTMSGISYTSDEKKSGDEL